MPLDTDRKLALTAAGAELGNADDVLHSMRRISSRTRGGDGESLALAGEKEAGFLA